MFTTRNRRDSQDSTTASRHREPSQPSTNPGTQQQLDRDNRSSTTTTTGHFTQAHHSRRGSQDLKSQQSERELKKQQCDRDLPDAPGVTTTTTTTTTTTLTKNQTPPPTDPYDKMNSDSDSLEVGPEGDEDIGNSHVSKEQEQSSTPKGATGSKVTRVRLGSQSTKTSYALVTRQIGRAHV